jgi:hypothetical protein
MPAIILPRVPRLCEPCRTRTDSRHAIFRPATVAYRCSVSSDSPKWKSSVSRHGSQSRGTRQVAVQPGHARHPAGRCSTGPRPPRLFMRYSSHMVTSPSEDQGILSACQHPASGATALRAVPNENRLSPCDRPRTVAYHCSVSSASPKWKSSVSRHGSQSRGTRQVAAQPGHARPWRRLWVAMLVQCLGDPCSSNQRVR